MEKIYTSLGCPNCPSKSIASSLIIYDEKIETNDEGIRTRTRKKVYKCQCNECGHKYDVYHGEEKYIVFEKPNPVTCIEDVHLLASFESESGFESDWKICSITQSPYDRNSSNAEIIYLLFRTGDKYPILLSKQTIDEAIAEPEKARSLVINNFMSRYR